MSGAGTPEEISDRVHTVIAAAERAAEAIRADAEQQARIHLDEARRRADRLTAERMALVSELTDELIADAAHVREQSAALLAAIEQAGAVAAARIAENAPKPAEPEPTESVPEPRPQPPEEPER